MGKYVDQSGLSRFLSKLLSIFVKKTDLMGGASSAADGHPGIVPTPGSGNQAKFLRGDATWATPTNTTYSAGAGLTLDGIQFKHSNSVTSGTAGTSSATNAQNTLAVPYVTYDAHGHVTAAGTHTHTINAMKAATSAAAGSTGLVPAPASGKQTAFLRGDATWVVPTNTWNALKAATSAANGTAGYVAAPTSANFANRALMYLRSDATWQYLPLQNNVTTTATYYALDARQGKVLNDKINLVGTRTLTTWASYTATTSWVRQTTNSATLAAGTWLISIYARSAITTNTFQVGVGDTSGATGGGVNYVTVPKKEYNLDSEATSVSIIVLSASTTLYPWVRCGNGTGTTVYMQFYAVRLK